MASAYQTIQNSQFFNYHYFSKIRDIKPKIDKLTNSTQLYPSLESKKLWLLFKGDLWSRDLLDHVSFKAMVWNSVNNQQYQQLITCACCSVYISSRPLHKSRVQMDRKISLYCNSHVWSINKPVSQSCTVAKSDKFWWAT